MKNILVLEHVRKVVGGDASVARTIIPDFSMEISQGEFVAITGPAGSGKSTLLYLIGALDRPTAGRVVLDGEEISSMRESDRARLRGSRIGYLNQSHLLLLEFTALENVAMPMLVAGSRPGAAKERAMHLLDRVGLRNQGSWRPAQLSAEQQQRVAVARALANRPLLLLGDEPTGSLDSTSTALLLDLLLELHREGQTIVYATQDPGLASRASRRIHMVDGNIETDDLNATFTP